jgi:F-type H+-transporting ATPase subunit b
MLDLPLHLVANERPLINIDGTLFINVLLWIVLFVMLRGLLWKPMLRLIAAREAGMQGSRETARDLELDAQKKRVEFEDAQRKARSAATEERDRIRGEGSRTEAQLLADARREVNEMVDKQRAEINAQREQLRTEIRATVPALAGDIASKVLGREVRA